MCLRRIDVGESPNTCMEGMSMALRANCHRPIAGTSKG